MAAACCAPSGPRDPSKASVSSRAAAPSTTALSHTAPVPGTTDMVHLPGGSFLMGSQDRDANPGDGEGPVREVEVLPIAIGRTAVTNAQFAAFVDDTGYRTGAETYGWSFVFASFLPAALRRGAPRPEAAPWWCRVEGRDWQQPEGPGSRWADRSGHPVVHVDHDDASAYCRWAGLRLPTEAEWEFAARGGLQQARYPWGDELHPDGEHRCNIWQGRFPGRNTGEDGHVGTAPADSFAPNGFGLHNMSGNVWEWCADWWGVERSGGPARDPRGPASGDHRVMRGGSYLCHDSYCNRYRVAARTSNDPRSSSGNVGFRCVQDR